MVQVLIHQLHDSYMKLCPIGDITFIPSPGGKGTNKI